MLKVTINSPSNPEIVYKTLVFPDGTQKIDFEGLGRPTFEGIDEFGAKITWTGYQGDEELVRLAFITRHLQDVFNTDVELFMPYIPNARLDRVKSQSEVFTLKYFAEFINSLNFSRVTVFDPHSDVSAALFNHVKVWTPESAIEKVIDDLKINYIYFPDEGAYKRYGSMFPNKEIFVGHKVRDWLTGKIKGLEVSTVSGYRPKDGVYENQTGLNVLMIDDIISYGGTLAYGADELRKFGLKNIYAWASHTENSVLDREKGTLLKRLKDGTVKKIYTTNSLYTGKSKYVEVIKEF